MVSLGLVQMESRRDDASVWMRAGLNVARAGGLVTRLAAVAGLCEGLLCFSGFTFERSPWQPGQVPSDRGMTRILHRGQKTMMLFIVPLLQFEPWRPPLGGDSEVVVSKPQSVDRGPSSVVHGLFTLGKSYIKCPVDSCVIR